MAVPNEILELMQKLKNMTIDHGCTPAEAENAAARLHTLLQRHQVAISDLDAKTIDEEVERLTLERPDGRNWGYGVVEFAGSIAGAFDCQLIFSSKRLSFIGIESDVRVASFFFDQTHEKVKDAGKAKARREGIKGVALSHFVQNFLSGAGVAIYGRLKKQTDEGSYLRTSDGERDKTVYCSALVPVKHQKVQEFVDRTFPKLEPIHRRQYRDGAAEGYQHGSDMDLQRGLDPTKAGKAAALEGRAS